jgi:hypothetical protein
LLFQILNLCRYATREKEKTVREEMAKEERKQKRKLHLKDPRSSTTSVNSFSMSPTKKNSISPV